MTYNEIIYYEPPIDHERVAALLDDAIYHLYVSGDLDDAEHALEQVAEAYGITIPQKQIITRVV